MKSYNPVKYSVSGIFIIDLKRQIWVFYAFMHYYGTREGDIRGRAFFKKFP